MKIGQEGELKEKRGEIITHFSYLESLTKKYISTHYFKTGHHPIVSEIFEDEYFSFGLLFRIFEKVIFKEKIEFPISHFRRMGQLRNIVAHAQVEAEATGFSKEEIVRIYFKHGGEKKEIEKIFGEYDNLKKGVHDALKAILSPVVKVEQVPEHKAENPL